MKLSKNEFRKLEDEWYEKLKDSGFRDIEKRQGDEFVLVVTPYVRFRKLQPEIRKIKEEYFRCISQEINSENVVFRNEIDRYILIRHSEGARIKVIVEELESKGMARDRYSVRIIIRRYEMEWGIRCYDYKQLHKKKA